MSEVARSSLTSTSISPALAGRVIADAATGAHYAHLAANEEGTLLVHGDLRPETIVSSYPGVTLMTDYGALSVAPTAPPQRT